MRSWSVVGKYPIIDDNGVITHTEIVLASTTKGYATYTERVLGNQMNNSDQALVELARETFFKSEYADRAMAESVLKIEELENVVAVAKKFMQDANQQMSSMETALTNLESRLMASENDRNNRFTEIANQFAVLNGAFMEMVADYYSQTEESGNVSETESNDNVDGSDGTTTKTNTETE